MEGDKRVAGRDLERVDCKREASTGGIFRGPAGSEKARNTGCTGNKVCRQLGWWWRVSLMWSPVCLLGLGKPVKGAVLA